MHRVVVASKKCPGCGQQAVGTPRPRHLLLVGDCRDPQAWPRLLQAGGDRPTVVFTSPPYASQRKYDEASGFQPISPDQYGDWWEAVQAGVRGVLASDGSFFCNIKEHCEDGERHIYCKELLVRHVRQWGWRWVEEYAWTHGGTPRAVVNRFKNGWEPVWHLVLGEAFRFNPDSVRHEVDASALPQWDGVHPCQEDGQSGQPGGKLWKQAQEVKAKGKRKQTASNAELQGSAAGGRMIHEVVADATEGVGMAYPCNVLSVGRNREALGHGAAFPVALPDFFVRAYSDRGDTIADPFMGSGSTAIAAAQEGRFSMGIEISPKYMDVIRRRLTRWLRAKGLAVGSGVLEEPVASDQPASNEGEKQEVAPAQPQQEQP